MVLHLRRFRSFFARVREWAPLALEAAITLASVRMAILLFKDQSYFDKYGTFYAWLMTHFPREEWKWATLASAAALFKAVGMFTLIVGRWSDQALDAAFLLRTIGWGLSVIFWSTFGWSIQVGDPWSLGAICCAALAQLSLAALIMGPAMPEVPRGYEG